jgi:hypothetical protein
MKQQENVNYKIENSTSDISRHHERILKVNVQISETAGFAGPGRIVNKKVSIGFMPVARGILFTDSAQRLLYI